MKDIIKTFKNSLIEANYKEAAKLYFDNAYKYQDQFNNQLEKYGVKDEVFDIVTGLSGNYVDQL
tara:strand:- start:2469 stop:2660 length:192 start_codon:yes stop_codon:yes gene_type:complete